MSEKSETVDTPLVERAREVATKAHTGQTRWNGDPYITHPERVARHFVGEDQIITSLLHDVVEDTSVGLEELSEFGPHIMDAVEVLTHQPSETYDSYIRNVGTNRLASQVKQADLKDNLRDLLPTNKRYTRYRLSLMYLEAIYD